MTSGGASPLGDNNAVEMRAKRKLVEFKTVAGSELPVRVLQKRNGSVLGSFETQEKADEFLAGLSLEKLSRKPTRGPRRY